MNEIIDKNSNHPIQLQLKVNGPGVGEGRMSVPDLLRIMNPIQKAMRRIAIVLSGKPSLGRGRRLKEIDKICELQFVGWGKGSAVITVELPQPPPQTTLIRNMGQQSVSVFMDGLRLIAEADTDEVALPEGFDSGVLACFEELGQGLGQTISEVSFSSRNGTSSVPTVFNAQVHDRVRRLLERPLSLQSTSKTGTLEQINGHGAFTGRLYSADGSQVTCHFREVHADKLPDVWMHLVKVTGVLRVDRTNLDVDTILILDNQLETHGEAVPAVSFWAAPMIEELVAEQGVGPVDDLDALASLWPQDDDPEAFLNFVLTDRKARREIVHTRGQD